jgi:cob(I)alamin adenosyltransferase
MKIYTKTGDDGQTGLFGGPRVSKDDLRIEAYGTVDELNSSLGVVRAIGLPQELDSVLARIQHELFSVGAELATPDPQPFGLRVIGSRHIGWLEEAIDRFEQTLEPLKQFILPAGTQAAAALHLSRTVCRRAERRVVSLVRQTEAEISTDLVIYLNRVSDLLFVLARVANRSVGAEDMPWQKPE